MRLQGRANLGLLRVGMEGEQRAVPWGLGERIEMSEVDHLAISRSTKYM